MRHLYTLTLGLVSCFTGSVSAQSGPPKWSVGAIGFYESSPFSAEDGEIQAFPYVAYRGERFFVEGPLLGYRLTGKDDSDNQDALDLDISLIAAMRSLPGSSRNKITADIGITAELETDLLNFEFTALHDATDTSNGIALSAGVSRNFTLGKLTLTPAAEVTWQNKKLTNYLWGVTAEQNANMIADGKTILPVYTPDSDSFVIETGLFARYDLGGNWMLVALAGVEFLDSTITDNPGINKNHVFQSGLGFSYSF